MQAADSATLVSELARFVGVRLDQDAVALLASNATPMFADARAMRLAGAAGPLSVVFDPGWDDDPTTTPGDGDPA